MFRTVKTQDWALNWTPNSLDGPARGGKCLLIWWVHNWDFRNHENDVIWAKEKNYHPDVYKNKNKIHKSSPVMVWGCVSVHGIDNSVRAPLLQKGAYRNNLDVFIRDVPAYSSRKMTPRDFRVNDCSYYTWPPTLRIHSALLNVNMIIETSNCSVEYRNQARKA